MVGHGGEYSLALAARKCFRGLVARSS
jgi:hypothetical protein